jgi:hypothetical protein
MLVISNLQLVDTVKKVWEVQIVLPILFLQCLLIVGLKL